MRLFTSLSVSKDFLRQYQALSRKGLDARWPHPDDLHITLRFLGDVDTHMKPDIEVFLSRVRRPSFQIEIAGLNTFETGRETILYAEVLSAKKVVALAAEINEKLSLCGFDMPHKPFVPHVTLARLKHKRGLNAYIKQNNNKIRAGWSVQSFDLMQSAALEEGGHYKSLQRYDLK